MCVPDPVPNCRSEPLSRTCVPTPATKAPHQTTTRTPSRTVPSDHVHAGAADRSRCHPPDDPPGHPSRTCLPGAVPRRSRQPIPPAPPPGPAVRSRPVTPADHPSPSCQPTPPDPSAGAHHQRTPPRHRHDPTPRPTAPHTPPRLATPPATRHRDHPPLDGHRAPPPPAQDNPQGLDSAKGRPRTNAARHTTSLQKRVATRE